jgi:hypothetical protein
MEQLPTYSIDLIKELDKLYPPLHPSLTDTDREIWFKAGIRSLIDKLIVLTKDDSEDGLPEVL